MRKAATSDSFLAPIHRTAVTLANGRRATSDQAEFAGSAGASTSPWKNNYKYRGYKQKAVSSNCSGFGGCISFALNVYERTLDNAWEVLRPKPEHCVGSSRSAGACAIEVAGVIPVGKGAKPIANATRKIVDALRTKRAASAAQDIVTAPSGARGLSPLGGVIEHTGTNAAGGRVFTSTGAINQNDFAGIVNSGLTRGDDVHIFTGAHGLADGSLVTDASLLADDVARFGDIPGVQIHDLPSMSSAQVQGILEGPGTIIGGFCDSGACLAGFGG